MTRLSPKQERFAAFILMLRRNAPARVTDTQLLDNAAELIHAARIMHRLNTIYCERDPTTRETAQRNRAKTAISCALLELFGNGARWEIGDPRGFSVKLFPGDGSTNSFAADCYGVPID